MLARLLDPYNAPAWMNDQDNMLAWLLDQYNYNMLACGYLVRVKHLHG